MISYLLRWMLILTGVFALPVLLIRAQPYDDSELRAFLTPPEGCPAPCFMGIRPGVTTVEEAIAILEGHEWVADVTYFEDFNYVGWRLAEQYNGILNTKPSGIVRLKNDVVEDIVVPTQLKLSTILAAYGQPAWALTSPVYGSSGTPGMGFVIGYESDMPMFSFFIPARTWFGKLHFVLDTNIAITYRHEVENETMENPSLSDFLTMAVELTNS